MGRQTTCHYGRNIEKISFPLLKDSPPLYSVNFIFSLYFVCKRFVIDKLLNKEEKLSICIFPFPF